MINCCFSYFKCLISVHNMTVQYYFTSLMSTNCDYLCSHFHSDKLLFLWNHFRYLNKFLFYYFTTLWSSLWMIDGGRRSKMIGVMIRLRLLMMIIIIIIDLPLIAIVLNINDVMLRMVTLVRLLFWVLLVRIIWTCFINFIFCIGIMSGGNSYLHICLIILVLNWVVLIV